MKTIETLNQLLPRALAILLISSSICCGEGSNTTRIPGTRNPVTAPPTPLHQWSFDGNFIDSGSDGTWSGTSVGTTQTIETETVRVGGGSAAFDDNINSYIGLGAVTLPEVMTLTVWAYQTAAGINTLFANSNSLASTDGLRVYLNNGIFTIETGNGVVTSGTTCIADNPSADNVWNFYAAVIDRTEGNCLIYMNGALDGTGDVRDDYQTDDIAYIGKMADANPFSGFLDEIRIFDRILTPDEIERVHTDF